MMLRLTKTPICLCLLLISAASESFAQSSSVSATTQMKLYRLPDKLDGNIALDVLQTVLSGREGVKLGLNHSTGSIVASASQSDHNTIAETIGILEKPVRIDAENIIGQPTRSGKYLCIYALDNSTQSIAKTIVESLLAGKDGVRLAVDSKTKSLIVLADAPEHQLIATSLAELTKNSPASKQIMTSAKIAGTFSVHSFGNNLILLNSETGDTWVLIETEDAKSPVWTRINRDE